MTVWGDTALQRKGQARASWGWQVYSLFLPLPGVEYWANQAVVLPKELTLGWGDSAIRERRFQTWILHLAPEQFYWIISGIFDMLGCCAPTMLHRKPTSHLQHGDTAGDKCTRLQQLWRVGAWHLSQRDEQQLGCGWMRLNQFCFSFKSCSKPSSKEEEQDGWVLTNKPGADVTDLQHWLFWDMRLSIYSSDWQCQSEEYKPGKELLSLKYQ